MSFIFGVLLTHSSLSLHNDDYSLVDHDESENVAPHHRLSADAAEEAEEMANNNIELESSSGPVPTPPTFSPSASAGASTTGRQGKRHGMSMIGGGVAASNLATPHSKSMTAPPPRRGTFTSSTLIYITSCFGSSCLGMPWCFGQCGWALALIILFLTALVTQWGASLLLQCAVNVSGEPSGGVSIKQIAIVASPQLTSLPELVVVMNCLGSAIGALVVSGFLLPRSFQSLASLQESFGKHLMASAVWEELLKERVLWISIITACVLPLCFLRDITPLKYTGLISLVAVSFTTAVVAAAYLSPSYFHTCEVTGRSPCASNVVAFRLDNVTGVLVRTCRGGNNTTATIYATVHSMRSRYPSIHLKSFTQNHRFALLTLPPPLPFPTFTPTGVHPRVLLQLFFQLPASHGAQRPGPKVHQKQ